MGVAGFLLLGVDGICRALNALPPVAVGIALSTLLALALLSIGALLALAQERWRNLLARIALNNMTQGLCMFDSAARLVLCNLRYIEMTMLRREQLRGGMPLREMLDLRAEKGSFAGDPDRYIADYIAQVAEGRTEKRTVKFSDGRIISLVSQPLPAAAG